MTDNFDPDAWPRRNASAGGQQPSSGDSSRRRFDDDDDDQYEEPQGAGYGDNPVDEQQQGRGYESQQDWGYPNNSPTNSPGNVPNGYDQQFDPQFDNSEYDPQGQPRAVNDSYANDPYGADPYANYPYNADPYANDPYANDPYNADPYANDPYAPNRNEHEAGFFSPNGTPGGHQNGQGQYSPNEYSNNYVQPYAENYDEGYGDGYGQQANYDDSIPGYGPGNPQDARPYQQNAYGAPPSRSHDGYRDDYYGDDYQPTSNRGNNNNGRRNDEPNDVYGYDEYGDAGYDEYGDDSFDDYDDDGGRGGERDGRRGGGRGRDRDEFDDGFDDYDDRYATQDSGSGLKRILLIAAIALVVVLLLGFLASKLLGGKKGENQSQNQPTQTVPVSPNGSDSNTANTTPDTTPDTAANTTPNSTQVPTTSAPPTANQTPTDVIAGVANSLDAWERFTQDGKLDPLKQYYVETADQYYRFKVEADARQSQNAQAVPLSIELKSPTYAKKSDDSWSVRGTLAFSAAGRIPEQSPVEIELVRQSSAQPWKISTVRKT